MGCCVGQGALRAYSSSDGSSIAAGPLTADAYAHPGRTVRAAIAATTGRGNVCAPRMLRRVARRDGADVAAGFGVATRPTRERGEGSVFFGGDGIGADHGGGHGMI